MFQSRECVTREFGMEFNHLNIGAEEAMSQITESLRGWAYEALPESIAEPEAST